MEGFQNTVSERFPSQKDELYTALNKRLSELRLGNADASKEKKRHLESQIMPGIAAYETLQTVMPKEEALQTVHGYVEDHAYKLRKAFLKVMRIPGLYRRVPEVLQSRLQNCSEKRPALLQQNIRSPAASGGST